MENIQINDMSQVEEYNVFISALDDSEKELKIILKTIEDYENEEMQNVKLNIVGNRYVKALINKDGNLNVDNKIVMDRIKKSKDTAIDAYIGIIGGKLKDSNYPNIDLEKDFKYVDSNWSIESLIFLLSYNVIENEDVENEKKINNLKNEIMLSRYYVEPYEDIEEFKDDVKYDVDTLLDDLCDGDDPYDKIMDSIFMGDEEIEIDPKDIFKKVIRDGLNLNEDEELNEKDLNPFIKEVLEALENGDPMEYDDETNLDDEELTGFSEINDDVYNEKIAELMDYIESDENVFTLDNIILNFNEFLALAIIEFDKFLDHVPEKDDGDRELYNSGTIFSDSLGRLLKLFKEKVVESPDFDKALEDPQSYLESINLPSDIKKNIIDFVMNNFDELCEFKEKYEGMTVCMKGLYELSKEENDKEYETLLSKLVNNMESVMEHVKNIDNCFEKLLN
ncbi:MAG: hypothetical protein LBC39_08570 [Methanobrevibacter sp.]|jgi:hypothetical protein|nr:hypothetical protein [Candidatus Methanovirga aequatorialis]